MGNISSAYIENLVDCSPHVWFGQGVSADWIGMAERRLGLEFPPSYRWFLMRYGLGEIGGQEIFGIYETDFDSACGGDVVYQDIVRRSHGEPKDRLVLCDNDGEEIFYFDLGRKRSDGELDIYRQDRIDGSLMMYATDFYDFLQKRIEFLR